MSDDVWRRRDDRDEDEGDFGPPLFGDDPTGEMPASGGLSFGTSDTGPLPHWTDPPTGELPRTLSNPVVAPPVDPSGEVDPWSSFTHEAPVWSDDAPATGEITAPALGDAVDESAPVPRREPGRITIGTDPTEDRTGRPVPRGRSRADANRGGGTRSARPPVPPRTSTSVPGGGTSGRDMPTAVAVGLLIAAVFIGSLLTEPWIALIVVTLIIGLASVEYFEKVSEKGYRPAHITGVVACVAAPLAAYWMGERAIPLVIVLALAAGCATFISARSLDANPMPNMAITTLGITWIGVTGAFAAIILSFSNGPSAEHVGTDTLFLLALGVVANDVGALFIGSAAGRTPLRQWISPNKTLEGFIGGTVMTLLAMIVVGVTDRSDTWNSVGDLVLLGLVISITAPLGDLTESMFKRNLDVKDFGSIVRGHGGVLDRFDGFLFTLPAVYYLMLVLEPWLTT